MKRAVEMINANRLVCYPFSVFLMFVFCRGPGINVQGIKSRYRVLHIKVNYRRQDNGRLGSPVAPKTYT